MGLLTLYYNEMSSCDKQRQYCTDLDVSKLHLQLGLRNNGHKFAINRYKASGFVTRNM